MKWDSNLYDDGQSYVSEHGKELITLIPNKPHASILDLGCGTGDLTYEIYKNVSQNVQGVDYSAEMIAKAQEKFSHIPFKVCDACEISFENTFDVVFSNAVFHWIPTQDVLHAKIYKALKNQGSLVCEFGAHNNIANISQAFATAIEKYSGVYSSPFYFPTNAMHENVLKKSGFSIETLYDFDRPTRLPNEHLGLRQWVSQFFSAFLTEYSEEQKNALFEDVEEQLRTTMFDGKHWIADYRRLRVIAHKI